MRINQNFITRFLKRIFTSRGGPVFNAGREVNIRRHWKVISISFVSLLILLGLLDGYVAWRIKRSIDADITTRDVSPETISKDELETAINGLKAKEKMFTSSLNSVSPPLFK